MVVAKESLDCVGKSFATHLNRVAEVAKTFGHSRVRLAEILREFRYGNSRLPACSINRIVLGSIR